MLVAISSRHAVLTPRLEEVTREKIGRLSKYIDDMERAEVHFAEEQNPRIADRKTSCEVTMQGHGHHVRCKVAAPDAFVALDRAVDKLEHQLRKLKSKLVRRYHGGDKAAVNGREDATASALDEDEMSTRIVKSKQFVITPMTTVEAASQLEILGHNFYFFTNIDTGRAAVVYRRDDGAVGLIDEAEPG
jgi:putative sigma-54 modulation protein